MFKIRRRSRFAASQRTPSRRLLRFRTNPLSTPNAKARTWSGRSSCPQARARCIVSTDVVPERLTNFRGFMLTKSQVKEFDRNGFLNGGKVIDSATVNKLRSEL